MAKIKNSRGIFYTFTIMLIALAVFSFVVVVLENNQRLSTNLGDSAALERVSAWHSGTSTDLKSIFEKWGGLDVKINGASIQFSEATMTNRTAFTAKMMQYESFTEANTNEVQLNFSSIAGTLPLQVYPYNIIYSHPNGLSGNTIEAAPMNADAYVGYAVSAATNKELNASSCSANFAQGAKAISVNITGSTGKCEYSGTFDPSLNSTLSVKTTDNSSLILRLNPPYGRLTFEDVNSIGVNVNTTIALELGSNNINLFYPESTLIVSLPQIKASKSSGVRLL